MTTTTVCEGTNLGGFRVLSEIGSGGMGRVYLAEAGQGHEGLEEGTPVALKVVHRHLLEQAGFFKRFLREAEIGKSVNHENVVRTLEFDAVIQDGQQINYLVMEYVEGGTLRSLLSEYGTLPEALLREIAIQVTRGLVAIHDQGIVHRDLKPENVLVTEDNRIRIMDLGVAHLLSVSARITGEREFVGSLLYGAPEQLRGEAVGPSGDLYSLGVLLMELATGKNPFQAEHSSLVIQSHLTLTPDPPRQSNPEISAFLDELIQVLLAKTPANRFPNAAALLDVLEHGEQSSWWQLRQAREKRQLRRLPSIDVARDTKLHGRRSELKALQEAWQRAQQGTGSVVLVEGASGTGKTRLVDAFLEGVAYSSAHMLYGSYQPSGTLGGLCDAVVGFFSLSGVDEGVARYLEAPEDLLSGFAAMVRRAPLPPGATALDDRDQVEMYSDLLCALAEEKPVVWIVEDIHFASEDAHRTLAAMAASAQAARAVLVLTSVSTPSASLLEALRGHDRFDRFHLGGLSPRDLVQCLREAFGSEALADKLGTMIAYKSDGIPQMVFEMIQGLMDGQLLKRLPDGSCAEAAPEESSELSSAMQEVVETRLAGLAATERTLLDVASVQGLEFDAEVIARVLGLQRMQALRMLADLERRSGLIASEGQGFRFDQRQVQQFLYQSIPTALVSEYHWLIAQTLARRSGVAGWTTEEIPGDVACVLADHGLRSHRPESFLQYLLPALAQLHQEERHTEARELGDRALFREGMLLPRERAEVLLNKASCQEVKGDLEGEREALEEARDLAREVRDDDLSARAGVAWADHLWRTRRKEDSRTQVEAALECTRRAGNVPIEARCHGLLGRTSQAEGLHDAARRHYERELTLCNQAGDHRGRARATVSLGDLFLEMGIHEAAAQRLEEALKIAREVHHRRAEAGAHLALGRLAHRTGNYDEARRRVQHATTLYREAGDQRGEAEAVGEAGSIELSCGAYQQAQTWIERHLHLAPAAQSPRSQALALLNKGKLAAIFGDFGRARAHLNAARELSTQTSSTRVLASVLHQLGWLEQRSGDNAAAGRLYAEALSLRRSIGDRSGGMETLVRQAGLQMQAGHDEEALQLLGEVLALGRDLTVPDWTALAAAKHALLPNGDLAAAESVFEAQQGKLRHLAQMEIRFLLWKATGQSIHLRAATRLLTEVKDQAPPDRRAEMIECVPLYRDITSASRETQRD